MSWVEDAVAAALVADRVAARRPSTTTRWWRDELNSVAADAALVAARVAARSDSDPDDWGRSSGDDDDGAASGGAGSGAQEAAKYLKGSHVAGQVYVAKSNIAGGGLFAAKEMAAGTVIGKGYGGKVVTKEDMEAEGFVHGYVQRVGGPFVDAGPTSCPDDRLVLADGTEIDVRNYEAADWARLDGSGDARGISWEGKASILRFVNDSRGGRAGVANIARVKGGAWKLTRDVEAGEEILMWSYGKGYDTYEGGVGVEVEVEVEVEEDGSGEMDVSEDGVEDDGSGEMDVSEDGVEDDVEDSDGDEMEQTEIREFAEVTMSELMAGEDYWAETMVEHLLKMDILEAFPLALSLSATTGAWNKCLKLHLPDLQKKYQVKYRAKVGCCICKSGIGLTEEDGFWVDARVLEETWADADEDELFTLDEIVGCNRFCRQLPGMLPAALNARKR